MNGRTTQGVLWAVVALVALAVPFVAPEFWILIAVEMLAFALYATSFNLLLGYGGMLSFGQPAYFGLGAYACAILLTKLGWPVWVALLAAPVTGAVAAAIVGYFSVRLTGIYFAMLTFAFQMLFYTIALKSRPLTNGDDGITGIVRPGLLDDPAWYYGFVLVVVAACLYALYRITISPFGQTLRATREHPRRVQYLGVDVRRHQWATFVIAGAFAAVAGALFALSTRSVFPDWLYWTASAVPVVMAVLGGLRQFAGPILGAVVYVALETVISGYTTYWPFFMGAVIVALVLLLPNGLLGWRAAHARA